MNSISLSVLILTLLCINLCRSDDLHVGNSVGAQLVYLENVKLSSVPFITRNKNVFYSSPKNQIIKGISALDLSKSKGKVTVTAGGVGSSFVNVRMKSERGDGLNYQVQIFA